MKRFAARRTRIALMSTAPMTLTIWKGEEVLVFQSHVENFERNRKLPTVASMPMLSFLSLIDWANELSFLCTTVLDGRTRLVERGVKEPCLSPILKHRDSCDRRAICLSRSERQSSYEFEKFSPACRSSDCEIEFLIFTCWPGKKKLVRKLLITTCNHCRCLKETKRVLTEATQCFSTLKQFRSRA